MLLESHLAAIAGETLAEVVARRKGEYEQLFQQWTCHLQVQYSTDGLQAAVRMDAGIGRLRAAPGRSTYASASHAKAVAGGVVAATAATSSAEITDLLAVQAAEIIAGLPSDLTWHDDIVELNVVVDIYRTAHLVADTEGRMGSAARLRSRTTVNAVAASSRRPTSARFVLDRPPSAADLDAFCAMALTRLSEADDPPIGDIGPQCTDVVLMPTAGAALIHELLGHACEQDNMNNESPYIDRLRTTRLSIPELAVHDDPHPAGGYGSMGSDDDGIPCRRRPLVEAGRFAGTLSSLRCGKGDPDAGGNGRRANYRFPALPRATNTVVCHGETAGPGLYAVPAGGLLFIRSFSSGQVNPYTGHFDFTASGCERWHAEGGRTYLGDVRIDGDALAVLDRLEAVGDDAAYESISCGKRGQWVGVGICSPSMRFAALPWMPGFAV